MEDIFWKKLIRSYDNRRDIVVPGDKLATIAFCVDHFIAIANESIAENGVFSVALSGGSTPKAIYQKLADPFYAAQIDWDKVLVFWSDERCVPPDDPESNYHMAMEAGFATLPIPTENIFRMKGEIDPEKAAQEYETLIKTAIPSKSFDLVMLGMGEDGHTASLFPKTHGLHPNEGLAIANFVPQKNTWRLTLTFEAINSAKHIAVYVLGKSKASMAAHILTAPYQPDDLPIQRVGTPTHKALWMMDTEAAAKLQ